MWDEGGTYVETDAVFETNVTHSWNHGLGEIVTALLDAGMELTMLEEHTLRSLGRAARADGPAGGGELRLGDRPERLPLTYTLQAIRKELS